MATVQSILRELLDDLRGSDFKRFKSCLGDKGDIGKAKLEKADTDDTVTLLVDKYMKEKAGMIAWEIFKDMKENELALRLEQELIKVGVSVYGDDPPKQGAEGGGKQGGTSITATHGGTAKANTVSGCNFSGTVNFG